MLLSFWPPTLRHGTPGFGGRPLDEQKHYSICGSGTCGKDVAAAVSRNCNCIHASAHPAEDAAHFLIIGM